MRPYPVNSLIAGLQYPMSLHLPAASVPGDDIQSGSSSSGEDDDDQNWGDWGSDSADRPCLSLFENKTFQSGKESLAYDNAAHGFDLDRTCARLCSYFLLSLAFFGLISPDQRLIFMGVFD